MKLSGSKTSGVCVLVYAALCGAAGANTPDDALLAWANGVDSVIDTIIDRAKTPTTSRDHFPLHPIQRVGERPEAFATDGRKIRTACCSSFWVYDPAHHIAANYYDGSDMVAYAPVPPAPLPSLDLSRVISVGGMHLGMNSQDARSRLGIAASAVRRSSATRTFINARHAEPCPPYMCAHDVTIVFDEDRAVAIALADIGP